MYVILWLSIVDTMAITAQCTSAEITFIHDCHIHDEWASPRPMEIVEMAVYVGLRDCRHHDDQEFIERLDGGEMGRNIYMMSPSNVLWDRRRYRLCKLRLSAHSVHELLCSSALTTALVANEEARHRKVTGLRLTMYKLQFQSMNSLSWPMYKRLHIVGDTKPGHLSMPSFFSGHKGNCKCWGAQCFMYRVHR